MKNRIALTLVLAAVMLVGCGYRYTNAVTTMRSAAATELGCDEPIEVHRQSATAYAPDGTHRAAGCGRELWFDCEGEGDRMVCEPRLGAAYFTPPPGAPYAIVKLATLFDVPLAHRYRRHDVHIGDAFIRTDDTDEVRAIPVVPGLTRWSYRTADVDIVRELRPFTWTTKHTYRRLDKEITETQHHTGLRETSTPIERSTCRTAFSLDARPGTTYRVLYHQVGPSRCAVYCAEETLDGGMVESVPCSGFGT